MRVRGGSKLAGKLNHKLANAIYKRTCKVEKSDNNLPSHSPASSILRSSSRPRNYSSIASHTSASISLLSHNTCHKYTETVGG